MTSTNHVKSRNLSNVPARQVNMAEQINYVLGYHEAWEAHLHQRRAAAKRSGIDLTPQEETKVVEEYVTRNRKNAANAVICHECEELWASWILAGRPPLKMPDFVRDAITTFNHNFCKRVRRNASKT